MSRLLKGLRPGGGGGGPTMLWSDTASWPGGIIPVTNDTVTIPFGTEIILDTTTAVLTELILEGTLTVSESVDSQLYAKRMTGMAGGIYRSGAVGVVNTRYHRRELSGLSTDNGASPNPGLSHSGNTPTANYPNDALGVNRAFMIEDGFTYFINGYVPPVTEARLNIAAAGGTGYMAAGTTTLELDQGVYWLAGEKIIVTPSGFFHASRRTEEFTIAADTNGASSVSVTGGVGLAYRRFAKLQYLNDNNTISIDSSSGFTTAPGGLRATLNTPATIDQRARVILLSRRHLVTCPNDTERTDKRFGAHDMIMGNGTTTPTNQIYVKGVQFDHCGQGGLQGRYPVHFHVPNYNTSTGADLGAYAAGQAVYEDCVVSNGLNRAYTLHGCKGVELRRCVGYKVFGHAFFLEEGSEEENTIEDCRAYHVSDPGTGTSPAQIAYSTGSGRPGAGFRIKSHDGVAVQNIAGSAGFWITNLNNNITGNVGGDCEGSGIWQATTDPAIITMPPGQVASCFGLTKLVNINTFYTYPLNWQNNEGHSNGLHGREAFTFASDEQGNVSGGNKFGQNVPGTVFEMSGDYYWKNTEGGYAHTVYRPEYENFVFADNAEFDIHGTTQLGTGRMTFIQRSLNDEAVEYPSQNWFQTAAVSYHGTFHFLDTTWIGYAPTTPVMGTHENRTYLWTNAALGGFDNYTAGFFSFSKGFSNLRMGPGFGMYMTPGGNVHGIAPFTTWTGGSPATHSPFINHVGAFYDHFGTIFGAGAATTCIYDIPFFTTGVTDSALTANGIAIGMRQTTDTFVGVRVQDGEQTVATPGTGDAIRIDPASNFVDIASTEYPNCYQTAVPVNQGFRFDDGADWTYAKIRIHYAFLNTADYTYVGIPILSTRTITQLHILRSNIHATSDVAIPLASPNSAAGLAASAVTCYWRRDSGCIIVKTFHPATAYENASVGSYTGTEDFEHAIRVTAA
jgi:hypothetical protein